jgi:hypothetical protein
MIYTLADARREVADVIIPGGTCASGGFIDQRINSAIRRLMVAHDAPETQGLLTIVTDKCYVTLPRGVRAARAVSANGCPRPLWSYSYSFTPAGPGDCEGMTCNLSLESTPASVVTAFDLPSSSRHALVAFTASPSDRGQKIRVYGHRPNGEEILGGIEVPLRMWDKGVEGEVRLPAGGDWGISDQPEIYAISGITIPPGLSSYVTLLGVDRDSSGMTFLSKYHPEETKPGYRRYRIRNGREGECQEITFLTKLDFLPVSRDDDPLPVQSLDAIRFMVMAIAEENQRNLQTAMTYAQQAMAALNVHSRNQQDGARNVLTIQDDFGLTGMGGMYGY